MIPHYPGYSSSLISLIRILVYNDSRGAIQKLNEEEYCERVKTEKQGYYERFRDREKRNS